MSCEPESVRVEIDFSSDKKRFHHFFGAVGYVNVDLTYTPQFRRMYEYLSSYQGAPLYMRLHNILTAHGRGDYYFRLGDNCDGIGEGDVCSLHEDGKLKYDWTYVDTVYDIMVEHDMRPIVEMHAMPRDLQDPSKNYPSPLDYEIWARFIKAFVNHVTERYGQNDVNKWYFEAWNEPDNNLYWGSKEGDWTDFFKYYDYLTKAIKETSSSYKVGGPATCQGERSFDLFQKFLNHCVEGRNYATGLKGAPLDFVSVHCKGGEPNNTVQSPSTDKIIDDVRRYLDIMDRFPSLKKVEFFNDESDAAWQGTIGNADLGWFNFRNTHYFAGFICKLVDLYCRVVEDEYGHAMGIMDGDNCHLQWEKSFFSGNRSQFIPVCHYPSLDLIKKPVFNAYHLLGKLGSKRVVPKIDGDVKTLGVLPTFDTNRKVVLMIWNFDDDQRAQLDRIVHLRLENLPLPRKRVKLLEYRIDSIHSSAYAVWKQRGKPLPPDRKDIKEIRKHQDLKLVEPVKELMAEKDGIDLEVALPAHGICLLVIQVPEGLPSPEGRLKAWSETDIYGSPYVFLKWNHIKSDYISHYLVHRKDKNGASITHGEDKSITTSTFVDMELDRGEEYCYSIKAVDFDGQEVEYFAQAKVEIM